MQLLWSPKWSKILCGSLVSDINTRVVLGSLHAGMGNTHLNNLLSTMNVLTMNHNLFKRREREVGNALEKVATDSCKFKLNLEKKNWREIFWSICRPSPWSSCLLWYGLAKKGEGDTTLQLVMGLPWVSLLEKLWVIPQDARCVEYVAITN